MNDINDNNIMQWIDRFLDGTTTCAEEQKLYEYFSKKNIAPEAEQYREMMAWYASGMTTPIIEHKVKRSFSLTHWIYTISIAASIALLCTLGIKLYNYQSKVHDEFNIYEGSYIIRNGEKITDLDLIMPELIEAEQFIDEYKYSSTSIEEMISDAIIYDTDDEDTQELIHKVIFEN
ncbi:MAG: hypothetical protein IJN66_05555 [Muribaculaceae bacterium]|nr:hypothetical protein [Muribaculaceae bacterium]